MENLKYALMIVGTIAFVSSCGGGSNSDSDSDNAVNVNELPNNVDNSQQLPSSDTTSNDQKINDQVTNEPVSIFTPPTESASLQNALFTRFTSADDFDVWQCADHVQTM